MRVFSSSNELENCKGHFSLCGGTFFLKKREQNCASWRHEILLPCIKEVVWRMRRKCMWQNRWLVLIGIKSFRSAFCFGNYPCFPLTWPQGESVFRFSVVLWIIILNIISVRVSSTLFYSAHKSLSWLSQGHSGELRWAWLSDQVPLTEQLWRCQLYLFGMYDEFRSLYLCNSTPLALKMYTNKCYPWQLME